MFNLRFTVFTTPQMLRVALSCLLVAIVCSLVVISLVPSARKLDAAKFNDFVTYLKVFIAFMLGMFLNNAFRRWWTMMLHFSTFLISIKQLLYMLHVNNIPEEMFKDLQRLTVLSMYFLNEEINQSVNPHTYLQTVENRKKRWKTVERKLLEDKLLTKIEARDVDNVPPAMGTRSTMVWAWIGESLLQIKKHNEISPPMYTRIVAECHECMQQADQLKVLLKVQIPFPYVHLLSLLVHLNNLLVSIACGLTIGTALAEVRDRSHQHETVQAPDLRIVGEMYEAIQVTGIQIVTVLVEPLLYQAFLVIAHELCYPFGSDSSAFPTEKMIAEVREEMNFMNASTKVASQRRASYQARISRQESSGDEDVDV